MNRPERVAQLIEHWSSMHRSQVRIPLLPDAFSACPVRLMLRVVSLYHDIIHLSKQHQQSRYMIFKPLLHDQIFFVKFHLSKAF